MKPYSLHIDRCPTDLAMFVHDRGDQHVSKSIRESGVWEPYETSLFLERLSPAAVVVDVGANIGYYSLLAAAMVGELGKVFSFEPDPENFNLLEKNLQLNTFPWVNAVAAALSDSDSDGQLYLNNNNYGDHQIYDDGSGRSSRAIRLLQGNDYFNDKINHIDVLKVDTQGAEYRVIKGLLPLLKKSRRRLSIIIEFWPYGLRKAGADGQALVTLLLELELPFHIIDHDGGTLIPCSEKQLREWVEMVDSFPEDQGFMNILVGR